MNCLKKDYFDSVNHMINIMFIMLFMFNGIKPLLKVSKTYVHHTLKYIYLLLMFIL